MGDHGVADAEHFRVLHLGERADELRPLPLEGVEPARLPARDTLGVIRSSRAAIWS